MEVLSGQPVASKRHTRWRNCRRVLKISPTKLEADVLAQKLCHAWRTVTVLSRIYWHTNPFLFLWDRHIGRILTARRMNYLKSPETSTIHSVLYQAVRKARRFNTSKVKNMLVVNGIDHVKTEWAFSAVSGQEKDGRLTFCADCRRPDAVTIRDFFHLPKIEEVIHFPGRRSSNFNARHE